MSVQCTEALASYTGRLEISSTAFKHTSAVDEICKSTTLSRDIASRIVRRFSDERHATIVKLLAEQKDGYYHDPIQDLPDMANVTAAAEDDTHTALTGIDQAEELGFCHLFWRTMKRIFQAKYGIDWLSPSEMNPDEMFE